MGIKLFVSNSLYALVDALNESMNVKTQHILLPEYIVIQTEGMSNWLTLQIADSQGIAANLQFLKPNDLIQYIYRLVSDHQQSPFSRQGLDWLVFQVLGSEEFQLKYPDKAAYFLNDRNNADQRRLSLARRLSDLFDQYQVYRTTEIILWNQSELSDIDIDFQWQAYIWKQIKSIAADKLPDMTVIQSVILAALQSPEKVSKIKERIPNIYLFGLSVITSYHIHVFYQLAQHIPLNIYLLNPAPDFYWISDLSERDLLRMIRRKNNLEYLSRGNELLLNWGKLIQATFGMLYENDALINAQVEVGVKAPERNSLLHKIQNDIFNNKYEEIKFNTVDLQDKSLQIVGNYSKVREVQVLYNYLAELFDFGLPGLKAREVLVMVNNIADYSPFIRAIFDNAPYKLPFTIADEPLTNGDTPISCLLAIFSLNESNITAENVLQLLEFTCIRLRYGLSDIHLLRQAVNEASIRYGMDNSLENDSYLVSWRYGLQRIIYGLCISGEPIINIDGNPLIPLDKFEGTFALEQLSLFALFVDDLFHNIRQRKKLFNMSAWVQFTRNTIEKLMDISADENEKYYKIIDNHLRNYVEISTVVDEELSFESFSIHLQSNLSHEQQSRLFSSGGITFCSLIPMRSIPFRVIALLGMGFNDFPRKENKADFDLIHQQHQLGDRNIKDNDKQLFLDTVLSAEDRLFISYPSRSLQDNSTLPPSILVDELLEYIQSGYNHFCHEEMIPPVNVRKYLFTQHPLHNFSNKYNRQDQYLINYLLNSRMSNVSFTVENPEEKDTDLSAINIKDLISFARHPIQNYYNLILGIYFREDKVLIPDTELFNLDRLGESILQKAVIHDVLIDDDPVTAVERYYLSGSLPLLNLGAVFKNTAFSFGNGLQDYLRQLVKDDKVISKKITLQLHGINITGDIPYVINDSMISIITNKTFTSNLMNIYITYLAGIAAGLINHSIIIHINEQAHIRVVYESKYLAQELAIDYLLKIINIYKRSKSELVIYSPLFYTKSFSKCETDAACLNTIKMMVENTNENFADIYLADAYRKGMTEKEGVLSDIRTMNALYDEASQLLGINAKSEINS